MMSLTVRMRAMRPTGTLLCLASGAAFGAMAAFGKLAYGQGATVGTLLAIRFVFAAAVFWALVLAGGCAHEVRALSRRDLGVGLGLGGCGYAISLFFAGLRRAGPTTASILATVEPLVTVVLAFLILGETLGVTQLGGGALVLTGALVVHTRLAHQRQPAKPQAGTDVMQTIRLPNEQTT